ncbi:GGDEF domain-containing protein, partial [Salmonella enterica subsp. enterica serovar Enteritidis]|nr:GGDEF domain-containing protein [Salmonella enterica subsp. enterica serovar Enteritidis]
MKSKTAELGLRTDLNLLAFLFLTAVTAVFMA